MTEIPLLLVTGILILFFATNSKARDVARAAAKRETIQRNCIFLDDSIAMKSLKIKRIHGKLSFFRSYAFEYNESDFKRYDGKIELLGYRVKSVHFFHPDHINQ